MNERLKYYRKLSGLSQEDVAKRLNVSRVTISAIELGKRKVKTEELPVFAKLYGISLSVLLYGKDDNVDSAKIKSAVDELSDEEKKEVGKFIDYLVNKRK